MSWPTLTTILRRDWRRCSVVEPGTVIEPFEMETFLGHAVHELVPIAFVATDIEAPEFEAAEMVQEPSDARHSVPVPPGIDDPGGVAFARARTDSSPAPAKSQKAVMRPGLTAGGIIEQAADMLQADHGIAGIVEPFGPVFDPKYAILQVLAVRLDFGLGRHAGRGLRARGRCARDAPWRS